MSPLYAPPAAGGGAPSGAAGGVLGGTYPDPAFAADMATQAELDAALAKRGGGQPGYGSGSWCIPNGIMTETGGAGNTAFTQSRLHFAPFFVDVAWSIDRVGFYLSTVAASSSVRIGIYNPTSGGLPGTLLADYGTVATVTGTGEKTITVAQTLTPGMYWLGVVSQGGAPTLYRYWVGLRGLPTLGPATVPGNNAPAPPMQASITGALPDPAVPVYTNAVQYFPLIQFRTA